MRATVMTSSVPPSDHNAKLGKCHLRYINTYFSEEKVDKDNAWCCSDVHYHIDDDNTTYYYRRINKLFLIDNITFRLPENFRVYNSKTNETIIVNSMPGYTELNEKYQKLCPKKLILPAGTRVANNDGLPISLSDDLEVIFPESFQLLAGIKYTPLKHMSGIICQTTASDTSVEVSSYYHNPYRMKDRILTDEHGNEVFL